MADRKQTTVPFLAALFRTRSNEFFIAELQRRGIEDLVPAHGDLFAHLFGGKSLTVTELAERTGRTKSTVSVLAGKLEKAGYLLREPDPADARLLRLRLTPKGEALDAVFSEISEELHRRMLAALGSADLAQLERLLEKSTRIFTQESEASESDEDSQLSQGGNHV